MKSQKEIIREKNWDNLVVLDACRYDYFSDTYGGYLEGNLKEVWSGGSNTATWTYRTFKEKNFQDTVYVSGSPGINSQGTGFTKVVSENLFKVVDAWKDGWDEQINTTPPEVVGKRARITKAKYPSKRQIIHFVQPHLPYISLPPTEQKKARAEVKEQRSKFRKFAGKIFKKTIGSEKTLAIRRFLELTDEKNQTRSAKIMKSIAERYGDKELRNAYRDNLKYVLEEVSKLTERLPGKSVITADHGDFLGEGGRYGHNGVSDHEILRRVPWLKIK